MCGLVGIYSSNMFNKHKKVLTDLLYLDTWRGRDSTGVAALRQNADTEVYKMTVPGCDFIDTPRYDQHLKYTDFCWIGHNRYGTVGRNVKSNAHPFVIENDEGQCVIVGAHNGTLKNKGVLEGHADFGTDSEALFNNIAIHGVEESIAKIEGAWAISYYDHHLEELRFIRNKERPLYYAYEEDHKTLIWASEQWMIRIACSRNDVKLEKDTVYSFSEDTLYSFPAPEKMNDKLTMRMKGGVTSKVPAFFQTTSSGRVEAVGTQKTTVIHNQHGQQILSSPSGTETSADGEKQLLTSGRTSVSQSNISDINAGRLWKGFGGTRLTIVELGKQLADGCSWCELEEIKPNDKYAWLAPSKPICHKCLVGEEDPQEEAFKSYTVN